MGFGFASVENFIFTAQVSQNNFLGWGQTVSLRRAALQPAAAVPAVVLDPYFLDTDWIFSLDVYRTQID